MRQLIRRLSLFVLVNYLLALTPTLLAQSDTEPPVLVDFGFDPQSVDIRAEDALVTCEMTVTDSPAGVWRAQCDFNAPSHGHRASCTATTPTEGDIHNGTFMCSAMVRQYSAGGIWKAKVHLFDKADNYREYSSAALEQEGFPTDLQVASDEDVTPPTLIDFDFSPRSVDATGEDALVTCEMTVTDSPAGVWRAQCDFNAPSHGHRASCTATTPSEGDIHNGTFVCSAMVRQYSVEGIWKAKVHLFDKADNYREYSSAALEQEGFPTDLQVVSDEDVTPPTLIDFDFSPRSVDATGEDALVTCEMTVTDSPAGVWRAQCDFNAPSHGHRASCTATTPSEGDIHNGTFVCSAMVRQYSVEGIWKAKVHLFDKADNYREYSSTALEQEGFPTDMSLGFVAGLPLATVSAPKEGKRIRGNSLTVRGRLLSGNPFDVSSSLGVRFDYRVLPFGDFTPIPARNANHPNPDTTYPYFIHWDVSGVADGDYELRAVAHDLAGEPDPSPETITITIDHAGTADVEEFVNTDGRQENQTAVDSASESKIASCDHTIASTATELTLPPGALTFTTDTARLLYPNPADEMGQLEQAEQSIGAFVDLSLISGQRDLESGMTGDLNISFSDADQDGVVDGTSIREDELELRYLDTGTNSYVLVPSIVLTEHNMVHADTTFVGKFALAGPLLPSIWIDADKETLTWDVVSTASSYTVYRGLLSALVDTDADGLPDAGYGDCMNHLDIDPTDVLFVDSENPLANEGFYYVVGFVGPGGAAGLGNTSSGLRREPQVVCP